MPLFCLKPVTVILVAHEAQPLDPLWLKRLQDSLPIEVTLHPLPGSLANSSAITTDIAFIPQNSNWPQQWLYRLQQAAYQTENLAIVSPLSRAWAEFSATPDWIDCLVFCSAPQAVTPVHAFTPEVCYIRYPTLANLDPSSLLTPADLAAAVRDQGQRLGLCQTLYWPLESPTENLAALDPATQDAPTPLAAVRYAIARILRQPPATPCWPGLEPRPVQLHISHSWGGGIEHWLQDFAAADSQRINLVLKSGGHYASQTYGQTLTLYLYTPDNAYPLQTWELSDPITATAMTHTAYRHILDTLIQRYRINALLVSSLIGHSLDCLTTPLPTLMVWHDYYPFCPALNLYFEHLCHLCTPSHLHACLANNPYSHLFNRNSSAHWQRVRQRLLEHLTQPHIRLIAPSASVVQQISPLQPELAPRFAVIAHGARPFPLARLETDHPRPTPDKLRILVLGRLTPGKGLALLQQILPATQDFTQWYLLGCGAAAALSLKAYPNLTLTPDYSWAELPQRVAEFQPDCSLLLSIVPETYSYTLSELLALRIPPIATAIGSFAERIVDGQTGLLWPPIATVWIDGLTRIHAQRGELHQIGQHLADYQPSTRQEMVIQYHAQLPVADSLTMIPLDKQKPAPELTEYQTNWLWQQLDNAEHQLQTQQTRIVALDHEQAERLHWIQALQADMDDLTQQRDQSQQALHQQQQDFAEQQQTQQQQQAQQQQHYAEQVQQYEYQIEQQHQHIQQLHQARLAQREEFLTSSSWRLTAPLRAVTLRARALNSQRQRYQERLNHHRQRIRQSLRIRGLIGTAQRIYQLWQSQRPATTLPLPAPLVEPSATVLHALTFDTPTTPLVTIIIPVYNQYHYTYACLQSLQQHATPAIATEIIVVDDASTDLTPELLAMMHGIRVQRQAQNSGFIAACNAGAQQARGAYLVFLNNDTVVTAHWLQALLDTFQQRTDAGLVGAKLVYPDGRLQEAGGIIFADGSGWNYGRFDNPQEPRFNYLREVDYCSGACLMIPTALFQAVGGFEDCYQPAYYEDTDLAFKIRANGKKVWYQPQATVIHYEGISSGTDLTQGTKRFQVINQQKFQQRWQTALLQQGQPGTAIESLKQRNRRARILVIDACTPTPDQDSGSVRMVNILSILQRMDCQVSFFADNLLPVTPYTQQLQALGIEVWYRPYLQSVHDYLQREGAALDAVLISRYYIAQPHLSAIRQYCPQAKVLFDTVDLHYLREQRQAELTHQAALYRQAAVTRQQEQAVMAASDVTLVVSPVEQQLLAQEMPQCRVVILSNIHPVHGTQTGFQARRDILFVGGFEHPPNVDAMLWFTQEILPLIWQTLPELKLYLIGSKAPKAITALAQERVIVTGYVAELEPYLHQCRLSVAPLRYGAGVKGKINTSMSYGLPVVATSLAIEGMQLQAEHEVLVADQATDFAQQVIRLYQDPVLWQHLSDRAGENIQRHFSFAVAEQTLRQLLGL